MAPTLTRREGQYQLACCEGLPLRYYHMIDKLHQRFVYPYQHPDLADASYGHTTVG